MFGPNLSYAAVERLFGDEADTGITLVTPDIDTNQRTMIISMYLYGESPGPGVSVYIDIKRKSDGTLLQRIIRFNPSVGNPFSFELLRMSFVGVFGEAFQIEMNVGDGTRTLGYVNYVIL